MKEIDFIVMRSPVEIEARRAEALEKIRAEDEKRFWGIIYAKTDGLMVVE